MSSNDLKPCPFCGKDEQNIFPPTCRKSDPYDPADRAYPIVRCFGCFTEVAGNDWDHSRKSAVEKWNTRAGDGLVEKLTATLKGDREIKPMLEETLERILDFEEQVKALAGPSDTASLSWADQKALINEAILAFRAREALALAKSEGL